MVYRDLGPRDGPALVICHGLAAAGRQFADDADHFAAAGYRVLLPDLRGHGQSGKPARIDPQNFALERMALDLVEMLDHAGADGVRWIGNSLGGILALSLLGTHPGRITKLATFGTAYALSLPQWGSPIIPFGAGVIGKRLTAWATAQVTTSDPAAKKLIAEILAGNDFRCVGATAHNCARYDFIANARRSTIPLLLLRCGRDRAVNSALGPTLEAMTGQPNFTLVGIPAGGHCANLDATAEWRAAMDAFLA